MKKDVKTLFDIATSIVLIVVNMYLMNSCTSSSSKQAESVDNSSPKSNKEMLTNEKITVKGKALGNTGFNIVPGTEYDVDLVVKSGSYETALSKVSEDFCEKFNKVFAFPYTSGKYKSSVKKIEEDDITPFNIKDGVKGESIKNLTEDGTIKCITNYFIGENKGMFGFYIENTLPEVVTDKKSSTNSESSNTTFPPINHSISIQLEY
jgi:hypothetical protein